MITDIHGLCGRQKKDIGCFFGSRRAAEACCCSDGSVHDFAALIAHHSVLLSGNGNCDRNISK
ncbi:hypothetical protein [Acinetobacter sp. CWB-B33]|uniref:hypothetical protein n=1 Tax=Acinetobacter sp. CWB-B33 TaxID=2815724 RepID=UPI0031FE6F94